MAEGENPNKCYALCIKVNPVKQRVFHALMGAAALMNAYTMRGCLSVTMPELVIPRNHSQAKVEKKEVCAKAKDFDQKVNKGTYNWDQTLQGFILSSFYIGYLLLHIPGGILADRYGSKWTLSLGIGSTAIFTLLTPITIKSFGSDGLITLRVLMGAGEGTTFPALSVLMADWIPIKERGLLGSIVMGAGQIGSLLGTTVSGWVLLDHNWKYVFYLWGIMAILWFIFYTFLCHSSPFKHPCVGDKEKQYIMDTVGDASARRRELPFPPVCAIFTSVPMWALISAQIGHDWAFYILVTHLPKYFSDVLQIRIEKTGFMTALPSLVMWICSVLSGIIADALIRSDLMTTTQVRKLMTAVAAFGPSIFLVWAGYAGCNPILVTAIFCAAMGTMGAYYGGMKLTPIDMSPNYAGFVMATTNGIGSLCGVIAPTTVGWLTPNTTKQEWQVVFWVAFTILNVSAIIYCIWAKSEIQPWNEPKRKAPKE